MNKDWRDPEYNMPEEKPRDERTSDVLDAASAFDPLAAQPTPMPMIIAITAAFVVIGAIVSAYWPS